MKNNITLINIGIILLITMFLSCSNSNYDESMLHGNWTVDSWVIELSGNQRSNQMDMNFKTDGRYSINYGTESEKGKYWIMGDFLHTIEQEQSEKKVRILNLVTDTLKIQMNRGGELELVTLVKK